MSNTYSLPKMVAAELESRDVTWEIRGGGKHGKLIVNGVLCGTIHQGNQKDDPRFARNLRAQVRRAIQK